MSWRRFPTFLPNFPLKLIPLSEAQQTLYEKTGFLKDLVFKTVPQVNKVRRRFRPIWAENDPAPPRHSLTLPSLSLPSQAEVKAFLEKAYGLEVDSVRTLNVEGKKKRSRVGYYRRPDYKKVYVTLKEPAGGATAPATQ